MDTLSNNEVTRLCRQTNLCNRKQLHRVSFAVHTRQGQLLNLHEDRVSTDPPSEDGGSAPACGLPHSSHVPYGRQWQPRPQQLRPPPPPPQQSQQQRQQSHAQAGLQTALAPQERVRTVPVPLWDTGAGTRQVQCGSPGGRISRDSATTREVRLREQKAKQNVLRDAQQAVARATAAAAAAAAAPPPAGEAPAAAAAAAQPLQYPSGLTGEGEAKETTPPPAADTATGTAAGSERYGSPQPNRRSAKATEVTLHQAAAQAALLPQAQPEAVPDSSAEAEAGVEAEAPASPSPAEAPAAEAAEPADSLLESGELEPGESDSEQHTPGADPAPGTGPTILLDVEAEEAEPSSSGGTTASDPSDSDSEDGRVAAAEAALAKAKAELKACRKQNKSSPAKASKKRSKSPPAKICKRQRKSSHS